MGCPNLLLEDLSASWETPLREDLWKPVSGFFYISLTHLFSLLILLCCNTSQRQLLCAESFKSPNGIIEPGGGLGGPRHRPCHQLLKISTRLALSMSVHTAAWLLGGAHGDVWESSWKTPNPYPNKCTVILLFFFYNPFSSLL